MTAARRADRSPRVSRLLPRPPALDRRRLALAFRLWWHRIRHPVAAARALLPLWVPAPVRLRLLRAVRTVRPRPDTVAIAPELPPESTAAVRPAVVVLPLIDWGFRRQRPQQLLSRLAQSGWKVLYLATELDPRGAERAVELRTLGDGVVGVRLAVGRPVRPTLERLRPRDVRAAVRGLEEAASQLGVHAAVVLCQAPGWEPLAAALRARFGWPVVYDRMDRHEAFRGSPAWTAELERRLLAAADLVVASSHPLAADAARAGRPVLHLGNGCDPDHWSRGEPHPDVARLPRPRIGYVGAISSWFDVELVAEIALRRPEWQLVLVGGVWEADVARLRLLPNVHLLGERPYEEVPSLASGFDAAIVPFRRTALTDATDPVKLWELLALGLDVVAPPLDEISHHASLVHVADGPEEFVATLERCLETPPSEAERERRRAAALERSWDRLADRLDRALRELFPAVTVAVISYGRPELTELCIRSLEAFTSYPRFEVVLFDNGSDAATQEALRRLASDRGWLRLMLSRDNLGFPAACNRALADSDAEILCLLNNDTVVTPGWLWGLVRVLLRHPEVGLVGASSNGVANEARVRPGYRSLAELPAWAERFVREHAGEDFSIGTAALFCAAIRADLWRALGGLDERFGIGLFEDDDLSRRVRETGYDVRCARDSYVHHWQQASFGRLPAAELVELFEANRRLYHRRRRGR